MAMGVQKTINVVQIKIDIMVHYLREKITAVRAVIRIKLGCWLLLVVVVFLIKRPFVRFKLTKFISIERNNNP